MPERQALASPEELSSPSLLRGLLDAASLLSSQKDLDSLLTAIGRTVAETIGLGAVVINLYRPEWDDFVVAAVHGSDEAREMLMGTAQSLETWDPLLHERFHTRGAYLIRHTDIDWSDQDMTVYTPDIPIQDDPNAWHPMDALMVPMRATDGQLLGILSVDEPASGRYLTDDELDVLVGLTKHASVAVERAQENESREHHGRSLERILGLSVELTGSFSIKGLLDSVCEAVSSALGFERVAITLLDEDGQTLVVKAFSGWVETDPTVTTRYERQELDSLLDPQFEIEGCYLIESEEALRRVSKQVHTHDSTKNGRGPHAWNHHWLVVPLSDPERGLTGMMWVDDPSDRLLPSLERLQTLRTFANQAAVALESLARFKAVEQTKNTLHTLVSASPLAIVALDLDRRVTAWNPAAERIFGWQETETVGQPIPFLASNQAQFDRCIDRVVQGVPSGMVDFNGTRKDGTIIEFTSSSAPLRGEGERARGVVCLFADITERNQLEEKLRHRQKLESIGVLAGGIAHDFNNLLLGMMGNASLAMDEVDELSPAREFIDGIQLAAESAAGLTQQLLAYSGQGQFASQRINLSTLAKDAMVLLRRVVSPRARFVTDLAEGLPSVEGDGSQIRQIAMNLLTNASEALSDKPGSITLSTGTVDLTSEDLSRALSADGAEPGPYVFLQVSDTGSGIDDESLDRIFDPFFSTKFTGRGLGLAAVLGIVRSHQGVIHIDTSPQGTTFRVCLPPDDAGESEVATTAPSARPRVRTSPVANVLVIDDEAPVRRTIERILLRSGIGCVLASDGDEGIEVFRRDMDSIDAVLLDLTMPGMPTKQVIQEILALKPSIRVVLTSGYTNQLVDSGFGDAEDPPPFLQKPYGPTELLRALVSSESPVTASALNH